MNDIVSGCAATGRDSAPPTLVTPTDVDIALGNDNERMIVANLWSYWAHLSIYRFAVPFASRARVLDAGTGVGYGAAYLAEHARHVDALDASAHSIAHARDTYGEAPNLSFAVADLGQPLSFGHATFDLVFSSNVFEHVPDIDQLAAECARVVKPDGTVVVAVPPITSPAVAEDDMRNHHHVHHLPPSAWHAKLSRFFAQIDCHGHQGLGSWNDYDVQVAEIARWVDDVTIRETDFEFPPVAIEELDRWQCITAVFVCRAPRRSRLLPSLAERMPADWHDGALVARVIGGAKAENASLTDELASVNRLLDAERRDHDTEKDRSRARINELVADRDRLMAGLDELRRERDQLAYDKAAILKSRSWRSTAPLRRAIEAVRPLGRFGAVHRSRQDRRQPPE